MSLFDPKEEEVTSTQSVGPPEWAQPHVEDFVNAAAPIRDTPRSLYPGSFTADMSPERLAGLRGTFDLAQAGGSGLPDIGSQYLRDVMGGKYLGSPHLAEASQTAVDRLAPGILSGFALGGREGSGAAADALGQGVGSIVAGNYNRERGMQQNALSFMPQFDALAYKPYGVMMDVGREFEADDQSGINEARFRHDFGENEEFDRLNRYGTLLGAGANMWGREGENTETVFGPSPFQTIAGVGLTAAGMASGNPMAAMGLAGGGSLGGAPYSGMVGGSPNPTWGMWGGV